MASFREELIENGDTAVVSVEMALIGFQRNRIWSNHRVLARYGRYTGDSRRKFTKNDPATPNQRCIEGLFR